MAATSTRRSAGPDPAADTGRSVRWCTATLLLQLLIAVALPAAGADAASAFLTPPDSLSAGMGRAPSDDTDGDGLGDQLSQLPLSVSDQDADGIFNFRDLDGDQEGLPFGCQVPSAPASGGSDRAADPWLLTLMALAVAVCARRRALLSGLLVTVLLLAAATAHGRSDDRRTAAAGRFEIAAGAGLTHFDVDTAGRTARLDDRLDRAVHVSAGYRRGAWRYAVRYADLGEARFAEAGTLAYRVLDLGINRYFGARRWQPYLRSGIGGFFTSGDVPARIDHRVHLGFGTGVEWAVTRRWAMRFDVALHDEDAVETSVALVWRQGSRSATVAESPDAADARKAPGKADEPEALGAQEADDADGDGVAGAADACTDTLPGVPVDDAGCSLLVGPVEAIQFVGSTDKLTADATVLLRQVLEALILNPEMTLLVTAHVFELDTAKANLLLSRRRALAVIRYLTDRGIVASRLQPQAFGETRPGPGPLGRRDRLELVVH